MDQPTDIRQVKIPTIAVGLIMSVAVIVGTVTWSSARLVARIDQLEAAVESIEDSMDFNGYARSVHVDELATRVGELTDSVGYLLEREHLRVDS